MASYSNTIERKAIDVSGRLGSFYDAASDRLLGERSTTKSFDTVPLHTHSEYQVFLGDQNKDIIVDLLKARNLNNALLESILLGLVTPTGISSLIYYDQFINENTCFLYYLYKNREDILNVADREAYRIISPPLESTTATHMITRILWGFEILCVIQVPKNQSADAVRTLLNRVSTQFWSDDKSLILTNNELCQISELSNVTVYGSVTCINSPNMPLLTILTRLKDWKNTTTFHHPLKYTMCSLNWLFHTKQFSEASIILYQNDSHIARIEHIIIHLWKWVKDLKQLFRELPKTMSNSPIDLRSENIHLQFGVLLSTYEDFRIELRNMLVGFRRGTHKSIEINKVISDERFSCLRTPATDTFYKEAAQFLAKMKLIGRLNNDKIEYINVLDILQCSNTLSTIEEIDYALQRYFVSKGGYVSILYSNDRLERERATEWEQIYQQLLSERQQSTQRTSLIYADFTQCQHILDNFAITRLPGSPPTPFSCNHAIACSLLPIVSDLPQSPSVSPIPSERSPSVTDINVLLLGETGVGKSTFINAFVNYLVCNTLQQAEQGKPIVLIPVSFLITTGDQFDEFTVELGDADTNENHKHQGESVTQQCKSYLFHLNDTLRLRLIDTPGMGDTRGVDQDVKNIDHILTYVNNLPHLNAVCLLLKPNTFRLNVFFRSCINQLLTYLTPIGYNNIIFCFTNARSTFFAPGSTGPLLRQMLKQEHLDDIPFQKTNTFCFDSESFRYLAARKCGINFNDFQRRRCINSWATSVTESVRLLHFIQTRKPYDLDEWQSPRKVALEISMLARPLMETLRLILYNWKLREVGLVDKEMTLNSNPDTTEICTNCAQASIVPVGSFWLVEYGSTKNTAVKQCMCPFNERHFVIEATVKHKFVNQPISPSIDELRSYFHDHLYKCDRLAHFLRQNNLLDQDDPFTPILKRFLDEEEHICNISHMNSNTNKRTQQVLHTVRELREQNAKRLSGLHEKLSLSEVYQIINELKSIRTVNQQIECIRTSRLLKMEANEYRVKIPSIENRSFADLTNSLK